jgi:hypothetical protein
LATLFFYGLIFIVGIGILYAVIKAAVLSALEEFEYNKNRKKYFKRNGGGIG